MWVGEGEGVGLRLSAGAGGGPLFLLSSLPFRTKNISSSLW